MQLDAKGEIDASEHQRESGDPLGSISRLNSVIEREIQAGNTEVVAEALGQKIVGLFHLYDKTKDKGYLEQIGWEIKYGLQLDIPNVTKSVFHYRLGDLRMKTQQYPEAEDAYMSAVAKGPDTPITRGEYLTKLAEARARNGAIPAGLNIIAKAISLIKRDKEGRKFHRLIVLCGARQRQQLIYHLGGHHLSMLIPFLRGYAIALWLKLRYSYPERLNQYHRAIKERM